MDTEDIADFVIEHVNDLPQEAREEIFAMLRVAVRDDDIDSSNLDGSRIFVDAIPRETLVKVYDFIKSWLEN